MAVPRNVNSAKHRTGRGWLSGTPTATASASGWRGQSIGAQKGPCLAQDPLSPANGPNAVQNSDQIRNVICLFAERSKRVRQYVAFATNITNHSGKQMPKSKKVITTRLDRSLVEVAQKRVEDLLNKLGAGGRPISPREAAEHALAAFSPENSKKVEERIAANTTVEIFSRIKRFVDQHELPLRFMISMNGNILWMRGPDGRGYYALAECGPAALKEALVSRGAEVVGEGFSMPWLSRDMFIERELTGIEELSEVYARGSLNISPVPDADEQDDEGKSND